MEYVSEACRDLTGHDAGAVESGTVSWGRDVVHPDDRDRVWETVQSGLDGDGTFTVQYRVRTADGETRWVWERGHAVRPAPESPRRIEGVITDVTEQRTPGKALREERERFRSFVDAVEEYAIFTLDPDGHVQSWNDGAAHIKGYDREEILGRHFSTFYTEADRATGVPEDNLAAATEEGSARDEGWRVRADGSEFWADVTITALRDDDGDLRGYTKVTRDMTERHEREQALREERNLLENVLETSPAGIAIFDADGRARRTNRRFAELLGLDDADEHALGNADHGEEYALDDAEDGEAYALGDRSVRDESGEVIPPSERPAQRALATDERVDRRMRFDGDDGTRWLSVTAEPLDEESGVVVTVADVTPLKERTRRLQRQRKDLESELEEVFERVDDGFYALDEQFRFTYVNERAEQLLDAGEEELLGESVWDVFPEATETPARDAFHEAMETGEKTGFEVYFEPLEFWVEASVYPSESGLSVHFRDVTQRKAREEQLERYAGILEAIGEPAYELDAEGRFTFVNDAFVEHSGYDELELLGSYVSIGMDDEAIERAEAAIAELLAGDGDGTTTLTYEVETEDGERRPVENRLSVLTDDEGRLAGTVGLVLDVSERKARQRELERYETIVETINEGVYVVDEAGQFTWANSAYAELTGYDRAELVGEHVSLVVDEETIRTAREYEAKLRAGDEEDVGLVETELQTADGETIPSAGTFAMLPDEDEQRRVGVARDITERRRYEEALTALYDASRALFHTESDAEVAETVAETVTDVLDIDAVAVYRYDDGHDVLAPAAHTRAAASMREELPAVPPDDSSVAGHLYAAGESRLFEDVHESPHLGTDATEMRAGVFAPMGDHGIVVVASREVGAFDERTARLVELLAANAEAAYDRVERERELERYETIVETVNEGVYVVDAERNFTWVNESYAELLGYSRAELVGEHVSLVVDDDVIREMEVVEQERGPEHLPRMDVELVTASGQRVPVDAASTVLPGGEESDWFRAGVVRDITERKRRERALEESERRYRSLIDHFPNGAVVLFDEDLRYLTVGGEMYDGLEFSAADLEGETMADWVPEELFEQVAPRYRAAFDGEDREFEAEFEGEVRQFHVHPVYDEDGAVFAGMVMSQDVTCQHERERELERQRERLAALNNLNHVVREITDAVVDQSTREEIERVVCERLAATDSYLFAWVGDVDVASETVTLRTEAGVEGYLEDVTVSIAPDDEGGDGPTARAIRTGEMQTSRDTRVDPDYEPWRDHAEEYGFRSSAAIPVVHEDTTYGVLNVYADRPDAFEGDERAVVGQLGEVVGHAIAAAERKRALMGDEVVELQFRVEDVLDALGVDADGDGTVVLDHAVPVGDGEFLYYGRATDDGAAIVETLVEDVPHWTDVTFRDDDAEGDDPGADSDGETDFELRLSEPPVLSRVASLGGSVEAAAIEDGDFRMTLHLSPTTDVRQVIDAVEETYPAAEMVKRRQTERRAGDRESVERAVGEGLTDRQRTVLEAAVRSGFFEWPRDVSGEDVAESLDVSPPTFHQHLRKAERKVFESLLSASAA